LEVTKTGRKQKTFVFAGGTRLATQNTWVVPNSQTYEWLYFRHNDASGASAISTKNDGTIMPYEDDKDDSPAEFDGLGQNVGKTNPYIEPPFMQPNNFPDWNDLMPEDPLRINGQIIHSTYEGMSIPASYVRSKVDGKQFDYLQVSLATRARVDRGWIDSNANDFGQLFGFNKSFFSNFGDDFRKERVKELEGFLTANPECAKLLDELAFDKFKVLDPRDKDTPISVLLEYLELIDATSNNPTGYNEPDEGSTLSVGEDAKNRKVSARATTNGVRFFDRYLTDEKNDKGAVFFHEILHVLLGGHVSVVTKLGLDFTPTPIPQNSDKYASPERQRAYENRATKRNAGVDEALASAVMQNFIDKKCIK
jgi:hypothetical protein